MIAKLVPLALVPPVAQVNAPQGVEHWLSVYFWLAGGILATVLLVKQFTGGGSQRREVTLTGDVIRRPEFDEHRKEVDLRFNAAAASRKEIHRKNEEQSRAIGGLTAEVAALREKTDATHAVAVRNDNKLDRILERLSG